MKKTITKRFPADHSPESIKDVTTILLVGENKGLSMVDTTIIHLEGTVEEKLEQYKKVTGKDWSGFDERVCSIIDRGQSTSLNLGQNAPAKRKLSVDQRAQDKVDALTKEAHEFLKQTRLEKHRQKLLKARERVKQQT